MRVCALTTVDNPYDYFKNPDEWEAYEKLTGSRVYRALGEVAKSSPNLSSKETAIEVERAIDEIILNYDPLLQFKKLVTEVEDLE